MKASKHNIREKFEIASVDGFICGFFLPSFIFIHFYSFSDFEEVHLPMNNQVE